MNAAQLSAGIGSSVDDANLTAKPGKAPDHSLSLENLEEWIPWLDRLIARKMGNNQGQSRTVADIRQSVLARLVRGSLKGKVPKNFRPAYVGTAVDRYLVSRGRMRRRQKVVPIDNTASTDAALDALSELPSPELPARVRENFDKIFDRDPVTPRLQEVFYHCFTLDQTRVEAAAALKCTEAKIKRRLLELRSRVEKEFGKNRRPRKPAPKRGLE